MPLEVKKQDFRQTHWGMSKEEVRRSETLELQAVTVPDTAIEILAGTSSVAGMPCAIVYTIAEDQLVSAGYTISGKIEGSVPIKRHTNDNNYLDDYEAVKAIMREKYGTPI